MIAFINVESITFFDTVLEYMIDSFLLQIPTLNISKVIRWHALGHHSFLELSVLKSLGSIGLESLWSSVLKPNGLRTESRNGVN